MTPTADDRGGSLVETRREAGFLLPTCRERVALGRQRQDPIGERSAESAAITAPGRDAREMQLRI
jgi:hypothetical protein